jgi:pyruvate kinase
VEDRPVSEDSPLACRLWYTLGPASIDVQNAMLAEGAGGVRLTFSFGTTALQFELAMGTKECAMRTGREFLVMADIAGEKFRLGKFTGGATAVSVAAGQQVEFVLASTCRPGKDRTVLAVPFPEYFAKLRRDATVVVGDGAAELRVTAVSDQKAFAEVSEGGVIEHTRGLTIRASAFCPKSLTEKDLADLQHVLSSEVYDMVALSFVSSAVDVQTVRQMAKRAGRDYLTIAAKIETPMGLESLDEICDAADVIIAARGDLALALPWVELPGAVERIAKAALAAGKAWILATQIVEGLERFGYPTCAETCDLARWLQAGCSGVLLSRETAFGSKPALAVSAVARMIARWSMR